MVFLPHFYIVKLCFFNSLLKFVMDMIMDMHIVYYVRLHNLVKHFGCMVIVLRVGSNG